MGQPTLMAVCYTSVAREPKKYSVHQLINYRQYLTQRLADNAYVQKLERQYLRADVHEKAIINKLLDKFYGTTQKKTR